MNHPPTDKELIRAGERYAERAQSVALAKKTVSHDELIELITTYADSAARERLDELRERFWMNEQVNEETNAIIAEMRESDEDPG